MLLGLALATLLLCQPADDWPPLPDFKTKVDYNAWCDQHAQEEMDPNQNAYELYRRIWPQVDDLSVKTPDGMRFDGFRHAGGPRRVIVPRPWDPRDHPEWEKSYQRTKATLAVFKEAAARPYYRFPRPTDTELAFNERPWMRELVISRNLPHIPAFRTCSRGLSEAAWRAEDGRVDAEALLDTCETRLHALRQLERDPMLISALTGHFVRETVYQDLRYALHYEVFSAAQRRQALALLKRTDPAVAPFERGLPLECACLLDVLQAVTRPSSLGEESIIFARYRALTDWIQPVGLRGPPPKPTAAQMSAIVPRHTAKAILEGYQKMAELSRRGYPEVTRESIEAVQAWVATSNDFTRRFVSALDEAYQSRACIVAERRATALLFALHVFHDTRGRWPRQLAELPKDIVTEFGNDPFTGGPFSYHLKDGIPLLYTVGPDCKDDGGRHGSAWKGSWRKPPQGDGVFWPIPQATTAPAP